MKPVNCNCDMPYGVYLDWLDDAGWCTDELRMEEELVTSSRDGCYEAEDTGCGYEYATWGDGYSFGEGWGEGCTYRDGVGWMPYYH